METQVHHAHNHLGMAPGRFAEPRGTHFGGAFLRFEVGVQDLEAVAVTP
jgi:hypothetical protein